MPRSHGRGWHRRWRAFGGGSDAAQDGTGDPAFREICEEYALAQRASPGSSTAGRRGAAEIDDYRTVIAELEGEIDRLLKEIGPQR